MHRLLNGFLICLLLASGFVAYSMQQWQRPSVLTEQDVVIAPGSGRLTILQQLNGAQLLPAPWKIALPFLFNPRLHKLKAGEYDFTPGMSPAHALRMIAMGKVVIHKVTVPEGYSVAQVRALLMREPLLSGSLPAGIAEGSLFPDTWLFVRGDTRAGLIAKMQVRMQHELAAAWVSRDPSLPLTDPQQVLVLASIVEAETGLATERPLVARVYLNRLQQNMLLQSDPTVAYGLAPGGLGRMLAHNDLLKDTPYNTYLHEGLPPGPVCNPGKAALWAATHPAASDALYFVATGNGGHWFAATLKEHEANVVAYRKVEAARAAVTSPQ